MVLKVSTCRCPRTSRRCSLVNSWLSVLVCHAFTAKNTKSFADCSPQWQILHRQGGSPAQPRCYSKPCKLFPPQLLHEQHGVGPKPRHASVTTWRTVCLKTEEACL
jgi:hypothetical protein